MVVLSNLSRALASAGKVSRQRRAGVVWPCGARAMADSSGEGDAVAGSAGASTTGAAASAAAREAGLARAAAPESVAVSAYDPAVVTGAGPAPRILIVDDEPSMRRVCAFALRGAGWRPETEGSSLVALQRVLGGERYDALVLDYAMPELDGLEFLRRLEVLAPEARPAVLMASAHADGVTARAALGLGVWDFLAKPLTPEELRRRVRRLLERPAAAERGEAHPRALRLASRRDWAGARAALAEVNGEADELVRGLLFELEGDAAAAAGCFSRARWWPNWNRQGPEIWAELARRFDAAA